MCASPREKRERKKERLSRSEISHTPVFLPFTHAHTHTHTYTHTTGLPHSCIPFAPALLRTCCGSLSPSPDLCLLLRLTLTRHRLSYAPLLRLWQRLAAAVHVCVCVCVCVYCRSFSSLSLSVSLSLSLPLSPSPTAAAASAGPSLGTTHSEQQQQQQRLPPEDCHSAGTRASRERGTAPPKERETERVTLAGTGCPAATAPSPEQRSPPQCHRIARRRRSGGRRRLKGRSEQRRPQRGWRKEKERKWDRHSTTASGSARPHLPIQ